MLWICKFTIKFGNIKQKELQSNDFCRKIIQITHIGMKEYAAEYGIVLAGDYIVMNVKQITHTLRESKEKEQSELCNSKQNKFNGI